jgi:predicted ATPase
MFCIDSNDLLKISLEGGKKPLFYTVAIIIVDNDINSKLVYFMFCKTLQNYIGDVCYFKVQVTCCNTKVKKAIDTKTYFPFFKGNITLISYYFLNK